MPGPDLRPARVLLGVTLALGCTTTIVALQTGGDAPLPDDPKLAERAALVNTDTVPLRDITGNGWDRAYLFPGPWTRDGIETTISEPLDIPETVDDENGGSVPNRRHGCTQLCLRRPGSLDHQARRIDDRP